MFAKKRFPLALLFCVNAALVFNLVNTFPNIFKSLESSTIEQPSIDIRQTADGHLAAVVKNDPNYPSTIFILKTSTPAQFAGPVVLANSEIVNNGTCVIFRSRTTGQNMVISLTNANCSISASGNLGVFRGFGLINERQPSIHNILSGLSGPTYPPTTELVKCDCFPVATPDNGDCEAGGAGASECSYSEGVSGGTVGVNAACSVKCGEGHYACCYDN